MIVGRCLKGFFDVSLLVVDFHDDFVDDVEPLTLLLRVVVVASVRLVRDVSALTSLCFPSSSLVTNSPLDVKNPVFVRRRCMGGFERPRSDFDRGFTLLLKPVPILLFVGLDGGAFVGLSLSLCFQRVDLVCACACVLFKFARVSLSNVLVLLSS